MLRIEDQRFLKGDGNYLDDIVLARQTHGVFVRSPHAHAEILAIDITAATGTAGVIGVFTGADLATDGIGPMRPVALVKNQDGSRQAVPHRVPMSSDYVRYVGDPVVLVVAESKAAALAGAERVQVDYKPLPAIVRLGQAMSPSSPRVWSDVKDNICVDWQVGDREAVNRAFAKAGHVTTLEVSSNRVTAAPMETRGAIGAYDRGTEAYCLYVSSQGVHKLQQLLARDVLGIPEANLRVVTPDVGGGFGMKIFLYSEYAVLLWAAKKIKRPVKWISERNESFLCDTHAREQINRVQLALDSHGRFLALRVRSIANLGAHVSTYGAYVPTLAGSGMLTGLYDLPAVDCEVKAVFTNTAPIDAYRGAGKPETNFLLERVVDCAARELGISPVEIRRRNFVASAAMPYTTALGHVFDSGNFSHNLNKAMDSLNDACSRASHQHGQRGVGISAYFEDTAGYQEEQARIHVNSDGQFSIFIGTQSNGQGHETTFAQLLSQALQISTDVIRVHQGDTQSVSHGHGTGGSRSLIMGGEAVVHAASKIRDKARRVAAHVLEAAPEDVILTDNGFLIPGTDKLVTWSQVITRCYQPTRLPVSEEPGLEAFGFGLPKAASYPNGIHVCEVFVDTETGQVRLGQYVIVDDFGHVLNPMIVTGQVHGGTVQGLGQALLEEAIYEADSGQLLSATFMDYCLPKADDVPNFSTHFNNTPCLTNELGAKGCGEAGAIAAPAAVINAIVDALSELGVRQVPMPATPERVWCAIRSAVGNV